MSQYPPPAPYQQPQPPQYPYQPTPKDPDTAFLIELVGGFFGFLGLGYFYTGRTNDGLVRLLAWLVGLSVAWVVTGILMSVLIGCLIAPVLLIAQVAIPFWSADALKKQMIMLPPPSGPMV